MNLNDKLKAIRAIPDEQPSDAPPPDWSDDRLLDAGEALYSDGRMVNVLGRRHLAAQAPRSTDQWSDATSPRTTPQTAPSAPASEVSSTVERTPTDQPALPASDRMDPLHREDPDNPQAGSIRRDALGTPRVS